MIFSPSEEEEEEEVCCSAHVGCLHWKAEPSTHQRGHPISKTHKCLGENRNFLSFTLSVLSLV
jgi:hypothetical protein